MKRNNEKEILTVLYTVYIYRVVLNLRKIRNFIGNTAVVFFDVFDI